MESFEVIGGVGLGPGLDGQGWVGSGISPLALRDFPPYPCSTWRGVAIELACKRFSKWNENACKIADVFA